MQGKANACLLHRSFRSVHFNRSLCRPLTQAPWSKCQGCVHNRHSSPRPHCLQEKKCRLQAPPFISIPICTNLNALRPAWDKRDSELLTWKLSLAKEAERTLKAPAPHEDHTASSGKQAKKWLSNQEASDLQMRCDIAMHVLAKRLDAVSAYINRFPNGSNEVECAVASPCKPWQSFLTL
eukprot:1158677-Pelagomonas_calceolata.AAC.10